MPNPLRRFRTRIPDAQRPLAILLVVMLVASSIGGMAVLTALAQSDDGEFVYLAKDNGDVEKFDVQANSTEWTYEFDDGGTQTVHAVAADENGTIYVGGATGEVHKVDSAGNFQWNYTATDILGSTSTVQGVEVGDGSIYAAYVANEVHKVDASTGTNIWNYSGFTDNVEAVDVGPAGHVYAGSEDTTVTKIDASTGNPVWNYTGFNDHVQAVVVDEDGNVYAGGRDNEVHKIDSTGSQVWTYTGHANQIFAVEIDSEGDVYSSDQDNEVHKIGASDGVREWRYTDMPGNVFGLANDERGHIFAGGVGGSSSSGSAHKIHFNTASTVWNKNDFGGQIRDIDVTTSDIHDLTGVVTDQDDMRLSGVNVTAKQSGSVVTSDITGDDGEYTLSLSNGTYNLTANKTGYINDSAEVTVSGNTAQDFQLIEKDETLQIDTRLYLEHGQTAGYTVTYAEFDSNGNWNKTNVTDEALVTSNNTTVVTVDSQKNRIEATGDQSVNQKTNIKAEYTNDDGKTFTNTHDVTVANKTVENLKILPPVTRFGASIDDKTLQVILIATGVGVAAALLASTFAGVAAVTAIMLMGWVMSIVPDGVIIVTVFTAMFIGMNVAGNVDINTTFRR